MIRVFEAFAGIGAQHQALKELGLDYEIVGISEIDKHAIRGYEAIHGPVENYGDITKIEHLPECDLLTYSYPCTSVSIAGKREGMKEGSGTASSLLWEIGRLLTDMKERGVLPEVLVMENVDAVLNKENIGEFMRWVATIGDMGYISSYTIMNAKDYGTPQNRRRIFMVSTLTLGEFIFPEPCPDGRVLRDVLEDDVPEEYFLSEERLKTFKRHKERNDAKGNGFGFKVHDIEKEDGLVACAVSTNADRYCQTWIGIRNGTVLEGELKESKMDLCNRVYGEDGVSPTVTCKGSDNGPNSPCPKIMVEGKLDEKGHWQITKDVVSKDGISPCVTCHIPREKGASSCVKIIDSGENKSRIVYAGELQCSGFQECRKVMSPDGISRTITAEHMGPNMPKIVQEKNSSGVIIAGELGNSDFKQAKDVMSVDGMSKTIVAFTTRQNIARPKILEENR